MISHMQTSSSDKIRKERNFLVKWLLTDWATILKIFSYFIIPRSITLEILPNFIWLSNIWPSCKSDCNHDETIKRKNKLYINATHTHSVLQGMLNSLIWNQTRNMKVIFKHRGSIDIELNGDEYASSIIALLLTASKKKL